MLATVHTCYGDGFACKAASTITELVLMFIVVGAIVGFVADMVKSARTKPCRTTGCSFNAMRPGDYCGQHLAGSPAVPTVAVSPADKTQGFGHIATGPAVQFHAPSSSQVARAHGSISTSTQRPTPRAPKIDGRIHFIPKFPSGTYTCQECGFETLDSNAAVYHLVTSANSQ